MFRGFLPFPAPRYTRQRLETSLNYRLFCQVLGYKFCSLTMFLCQQGAKGTTSMNNLKLFGRAMNSTSPNTKYTKKTVANWRPRCHWCFEEMKVGTWKRKLNGMHNWKCFGVRPPKDDGGPSSMPMPHWSNFESIPGHWRRPLWRRFVCAFGRGCFKPNYKLFWQRIFPHLPGEGC